MGRDRRHRTVCATVALGLLVALASGCASVRERVIGEVLEEKAPLSFDRPVDLMPPENLRVTGNEDRRVTLSWHPVLVGDVAGYVVTRSRGREGVFEPIGRTASRFDTVYEDAGREPGSLGDGQTYYYRVHAFDTYGRVSRSHALISATTEPRPSRPDGLRLYSNLPRKVVLVWEPSPERSVAGYAVYRSPTVAGPWERVAFVKGRLRTVHENPVPGDLRVLYYRIAAVNGWSAESDPTEAIRAVTKAQPLPPTGLAGESPALGRVDLRWEPNVEGDLARFEVWRSRRSKEGGDGGWAPRSRIGQPEAGETSYSDLDVGCGEHVRYEVRAVDRDGLESLPSRAIEVVGRSMELDIEPAGGSADAGERAGDDAGAGPDRWRIRWNPEALPGWTQVRVSRVRGAWRNAEIETVPTATGEIVVEVGSGDRHIFSLTPERPGAQGSTESGPACTAVVPPQGSAP